MELESLFDCPAITYASPKCARSYTYSSCPACESQTFPVQCQNAAVRFVAILLAGIGPAAVLLAVVAFIVYSFAGIAQHKEPFEFLASQVYKTRMIRDRYES